MIIPLPNFPPSYRSTFLLFFYCIFKNERLRGDKAEEGAAAQAGTTEGRALGPREYRKEIGADPGSKLYVSLSNGIGFIAN